MLCSASSPLTSFYTNLAVSAWVSFIPICAGAAGIEVDMSFVDEILNIPPYSLTRFQKRELYLKALKALTIHHASNCEQYRRILRIERFNPSEMSQIEQLPFLPVRLFKEFELLSISKDEIVKTILSSGTTGQKVSKIFLDKETALLQTKVLSKLMVELLGKYRLPMLVIDCPATVKNRNTFSARAAGILGFSMFGRDVSYALNDDMSLNTDLLSSFIKKHVGHPIFLFGFTFIVWEHFINALAKKNIYADFERGILLHGGGWKQMSDRSVDNETFKKGIYKRCNISRIYNYYGKAEQTGSLFMECEKGYLHSSVFSDIIIRNPRDFSLADTGERGLIQLISLLPKSYPGHSLLSEDEGEILGEDNCLCGKKGKYFKVYGRIKNAELRGCSDTLGGSQ